MKPNVVPHNADRYTALVCLEMRLTFVLYALFSGFAIGKNRRRSYVLEAAMVFVTIRHIIDMCVTQGLTHGTFSGLKCSGPPGQAIRSRRFQSRAYAKTFT